MIKNLFIQNFVLIDQLNLEFHSGFSVFTGETGAGKSILIDAISMLGAERASASFVMHGREKAIIEGTFDLSEDEHAKTVLQEAGFECGDDVTFTREIQASGKSTARIDHRIVSLSLMRDCLRDEIDIHGQRDNAYLLNTSSHIHLLDEYAQDHEALVAVQEAYRTYDGLLKEREAALQETYNENDLEFFTYQANEIEEADLKPQEEAELLEKEKQFKAVRDSFDKFNQIFALYDEDLSANLYELNKTVQTLHGSERIETLQETLNDAYYTVTDVMDQLHDMAAEMEMSEEDVNAMEERLYTIQRLKRKYGNSIERILEKKEELLSQIEMITHRREYLEKKDREIEQARKIYDQKAAVLRDIRKAKAPELDAAIARHLQDLMLEHARFRTVIKEGNPSLYGSDKVEFMISMNPGEELKSLSRTASGGELSRLMLGLKVIFTRLQGIQTVIFDEIDTGVSGPVATAIGRKMKSLAEYSQVFAVTHLAQVAACADRHYLVAKASGDDETRTSVLQLDEKGRYEQLALIASGEITKNSLSAAKELFRRNHS